MKTEFAASSQKFSRRLPKWVEAIALVVFTGAILAALAMLVDCAVKMYEAAR